MVSAVAALATLLALAGSARGHITFSPNAVVKAPYFTTQLVVSHGTVNYSTQVISIQTPFGVKVTPEQKPGWNLTISYRNLPVPLPAGHGRTLSAVPDVITYSALAGYALPNEWLFQAFFSVQLLGTDGSGCVYNAASDPNSGYLSAWYGDAGSSAAPQLGLFFPTTITLVPNYYPPGVGNDPSNLQLLANRAGCNTPGSCLTNWTAVPAGALSWYSAATPSPYITLPVSAWPACPGGVMVFDGANYTTTAGAVAAASGVRGARAAAGAAALLGAALAAALAL